VLVVGVGLEYLAGLRSIEVWQVDVEKDQVRLLLLQSHRPIDHGIGHRGLVTGRFEGTLEQGTEKLAIVDNEDLHAATPPWVDVLTKTLNPARSRSQPDRGRNSPSNDS
jgi:hypothetical protein